MKITVYDLINYLLQFDSQVEILLDKDGWMIDELKTNDTQELIKTRGIFHTTTKEGKFTDNPKKTKILWINN